MMRRSECITAVMVLASAGGDTARAAESARAGRVTYEAIVGRLQRKMRNIRSLPTRNRSIDDACVWRVTWPVALKATTCIKILASELNGSPSKNYSNSQALKKIRLRAWYQADLRQLDECPRCTITRPFSGDAM